MYRNEILCILALFGLFVLWSVGEAYFPEYFGGKQTTASETLCQKSFSHPDGQQTVYLDLDMKSYGDCSILALNENHDMVEFNEAGDTAYFHLQMVEDGIPNKMPIYFPLFEESREDLQKPIEDGTFFITHGLSDNTETMETEYGPAVLVKTTLAFGNHRYQLFSWIILSDTPYLKQPEDQGLTI